MTTLEHDGNASQDPSKVAADETSLDPRWVQLFGADIAHDERVERRLLVRELAIVLALCALVLVRMILL